MGSVGGWVFVVDVTRGKRRHISRNWIILVERPPSPFLHKLDHTKNELSVYMDILSLGDK